MSHKTPCHLFFLVQAPHTCTIHQTLATFHNVFTHAHLQSYTQHAAYWWLSCCGVSLWCAHLKSRSHLLSLRKRHFFSPPSRTIHTPDSMTPPLPTSRRHPSISDLSSFSKVTPQTRTVFDAPKHFTGTSLWCPTFMPTHKIIIY